MNRVKKDKKEVFLENSGYNLLSRKMILEYEYLIDDYLPMPHGIVHYLEQGKLIASTTGCKTSQFDDFFQLLNFVENIRKDRFFFIHRIDIINNKVILRYYDPSLEKNPFGLNHIRTQRLRDKKLSQILE